MEQVQKLSHDQIVKRQNAQRKKPKLGFCAVLNNIRSLYNVGSIFRTADAVGLEKLWLCGITGCPPASMIKKTALGAEETVVWEHREDAVELVRELKNKGYQIVLLEQIKQSVLYEKFKPKAPICFVLGNEITGVSDELLKLCDKAVEIEMMGLKNSLNVSVAFGILAYHIKGALRQKDTEA
ncbi:MAG: RNA methyltransferase [Candidatus Aceula meridiana]|nr:RNA methyltransferase [Candidatus Aceula meridiana]